MDYRKPVVFGENWSKSRYRVLPYFAHEKRVMQAAGMERILDFGCAAGWNMSRFRQYGRFPLGFDIVPDRVAFAATHGPVFSGSGLDIPFPDNSLDLIYIQHVLHHIGDPERALQEVWRCLRPGGVLFLVETVEDNPIIRWGRRLYPSWLGDEVNAPFTFAGLQEMVKTAAFTLKTAEQYSVLFWIWETLPDRWESMEKLTPFFVRVEEQVVKRFRDYSALCYLIARKPE